MVLSSIFSKKSILNFNQVIQWLKKYRILKSLIFFLFFINLSLHGENISSKKDGLIFVYNAKSGPLNAAIDYFHKILSPQTYDCNLCILTYDNFGKKKEWEAFLKNLDVPIQFLYADDMKILGMDESIKLPILMAEGSEVLIDSKKMNSFDSIDKLMEEILNIIKNN